MVQIHGLLPNSINWKTQKSFEGTGVLIKVDDSHYLGTPLGMDPFVKNYVTVKVAALIEEVESLSRISFSLCSLLTK